MSQTRYIEFILDMDDELKEKIKLYKQCLKHDLTVPQELIKLFGNFDEICDLEESFDKMGVIHESESYLFSGGYSEDLPSEHKCFVYEELEDKTGESFYINLEKIPEGTKYIKISESW